MWKTLHPLQCRKAKIFTLYHFKIFINQRHKYLNNSKPTSCFIYDSIQRTKKQQCPKEKLRNAVKKLFFFPLLFVGVLPLLDILLLPVLFTCI